ncbi:hypothetical protein E4U40_000167, partial [Claviceps sp. LM458 group G5]
TNTNSFAFLSLACAHQRRGCASCCTGHCAVSCACCATRTRHSYPRARRFTS